MAVNNLSFEEDFAIYKCVLKSNKNNMKIFNQIESSNTPWGTVGQGHLCLPQNISTSLAKFKCSFGFV